MADLSGLQTTNTYGTQTRLVRHVSNELAMLQPSVEPWISFLMLASSKSEVTTNPKHEWFEDALIEHWDTEAGSGLDDQAGSTSLVVTDVTKYRVGHLILIPQAVDSALQPEMVRVTAVNTGTSTLTVVRGVGSTKRAIAQGAVLFIVGSADEEGAARPTPKDTSPAAAYNYTQIFRTSLSISRTAMESEAYAAANGIWSERLRKKAMEHKRKMNYQFYFGQRSESLTGGPVLSAPIRTAGGLNSFVTTNVVDAGSALTQKGFLNWLKTSFKYGSERKIGLFSPTLMAAVSHWKINMLQISSRETEIGMNFTRIVTPFGELDVMQDRSLEDKAAGSTNGFAGWNFIVDPENVAYVPLRNSDTRLIEVPVSPDGSYINGGEDAANAEYLTEATLRVRLEKTHSKLYNLTDWVG